MGKITTFVLLLCLIGLPAFASSSFDCALVLDENGKVLYAKDPTKKAFPASLTKLMSTYIAFQEIKNNRLSFNTKFVTSSKAASMPRSKLGLRRGEQISVRDALLSLIVKSSNDVAVVLAEGIAGSEQNFATLMNIAAQQIGMQNTRFRNASGLHHPQQYTTAVDMAKLTLALYRDFPEHYHMFAKNSFVHKKQQLRRTNYVMNNLQGAEGMKTGYTSKAGWNIVTTARRNNNMLISIVLGGKSCFQRDQAVMRLMKKYFSVVESSAVYKPLVNSSDLSAGLRKISYNSAS